MTQGKNEGDLFSRFRAWFPDRSEERRRFFTEGLVILDANVLLNLYRMTPIARNQVLDALERTADDARLWLPCQAVEEFVRGRKAAVEGRNAMLRKALADVYDHFQRAVAEVMRARRLVQQVIKDTEGGAETRRHLERSISDSIVGEALRGWRDELVARVTGLQEAQDIEPDSLAEGDPVLDRINQLLTGRIGEPLSANDKKRLVDHFVEYRYPNKIPPGFEDMGKKVPLRGAGDYLLWEQVLRHVEGGHTSSRLLLLVTDDQKTDWRAGDHPHPELSHELAERADALLRLETTEGFLDGAREYLGVSVSDETYAEVARAAAADDIEELPPEEAAEPEESPETAPPWPEMIDVRTGEDHDPGPLARDALKASGFVPTPAARQIVTEDRLFTWWLIEATAAVKRRVPGTDEPEVRLPAITLADDAPQPDGWGRERLRVGEGIRNVWVAPWLARALRSLPAPDRNQLRRLAGERLTVDLRERA